LVVKQVVGIKNFVYMSLYINTFIDAEIFLYKFSALISDDFFET